MKQTQNKTETGYTISQEIYNAPKNNMGTEIGQNLGYIPTNLSAGYNCFLLKGFLKYEAVTF